MGGSDPQFEEAKVSDSDSINLLSHLERLMRAEPVYASLGIGLFMLIVFINLFLIR